MKPWQHFKTITYHRWLVRGGCFRVGLYWQGLTHDLSKYSPVEFWNGAGSIREPEAPMRRNGKPRATAKPGCTTKSVTATITNIGRI